MGVMPVNKLLVTMSLPIVISMLIQAMYNLVDSVFVAQINPDALTAVGMAFPMQSLMIAFQTGLGVGMNALVSRYLGQKKPYEAGLAATHALILTALNFNSRAYGDTCVFLDTDTFRNHSGIRR